MKVRLAVVILPLVLAVAGCTVSPPAATQSAPATSGDAAPPTTTPSVEPERMPPPSRISVSCADLVPLGLVDQVFAEPLAPTDPVVQAAAVGVGMPRMASIVSLGGLVCQWSNGVPHNSQFGAELEYVGVEVNVLPVTQAGWSENATRVMPAGRNCSSSTCSMQDVVNDAWITLVAESAPQTPVDALAAQRTMDHVVAAVAGASIASGPPTQVAEPSLDVCTALVDTATVQTLTGVEGAEPRLLGGGGWSDWAEARLQTGDLGCQWSVGDAEWAASVEWVTGGRWGFDRLEDAAIPGTVPAGIAVAVDDESAMRCDERFGCAVDLAIGEDWYRVSAPTEATVLAVAAELARGLAV